MTSASARPERDQKLHPVGGVDEREVDALVVKAESGGLEIVERLAPEWRELCLDEGSDQPFYRPEWVTTYVRVYEPEARLLVLFAREPSARLAAVLPLVRGRSFCGLPARKLRAPTTWDCMRFDLSRRAGACGRAGVTAIWSSLADRDDWDVIELPDVPRGGAAEALARHAQSRGHPVARWESIRCPYVPISVSGSPDNPLLPDVSGRFRKDLRRLARKLAADGTLSLRRVDTADPEALASLYRLERSGWKGRKGSAIVCKPKSHSFFDTIATEAERFGYLSLYFLELNGRPIAGHFGLTYANRYFSPKVAYDDEFREYAPGHQIVRTILQDCAARGISEFDILGDMEPWKAKWTSSVRPHARLYVFQDSAYGRMLHAARFRVAPTLKHLLRREDRTSRGTPAPERGGSDGE